MTTKIDNTKWDCPDNTIVDIKENKIVFKNNTSDKITIKYKEKIQIKKES